MQSVTVEGLEEVMRRFERMPDVLSQAKGEFFQRAGQELLEEVRGRIGGSGRVAGVQGTYVGSRLGYAAVRAMAKTYLTDYAAGYVTNALENGHRQKAGRYVPAMGKRLTAGRAAGKYMYRDANSVAQRLAREGAEEIARTAQAAMERG